MATPYVGLLPYVVDNSTASAAGGVGFESLGVRQGLGTGGFGKPNPKPLTGTDFGVESSTDSMSCEVASTLGAGQLSKQRAAAQTAGPHIAVVVATSALGLDIVATPCLHSCPIYKGVFATSDHPGKRLGGLRDLADRRCVMNKKKRDRALGTDAEISRRDFLDGVAITVGGTMMVPTLAGGTPVHAQPASPPPPMSAPQAAPADYPPMIEGAPRAN